MKDEFEFLERLFFDTYGHCFIVSSEDLKIDYRDKEIGSDLISDFDKIKSTYFDIAGQAVSNEVIQSMFAFRAKRLLNFKTKLEDYLKDAVNEVVLPNESYSLVYYKNLMCAYEGVIGLLKFITERLFVSLEGTINNGDLVKKYNWIDADQVNEWQEEFSKNYSLGDDYVLVDGITIDARAYSKERMFPLNAEIKKRILQPNSNSPLIESRRFGEFISHVRNIINLTSKDSKEQKELYSGLSEILNEILRKKDKFEREQETLNLLIETNVVPESIIEYTIENINKTLLGKNEKGREEILASFRKRLYKLKDSPSYSNYHISNIEKLDKVTLDELISYVESKLEKYNSLLLNDSTSLSSLEKIKTKLTVKQICLLFRLLSDDKVIGFTHEVDVYKHIALSYSAKRQTDISVKSAKNNFVTPDNEAIKYWKTELVRLIQILDNY